MKHDRIEQKKENPQATEAFKKLLLLSFTLIFYIIKAVKLPLPSIS